MTTFDSFYRIPKADHRYRIKETPILKEEKHDNSYINQVMHRALSVVDPRKYSRVIDWRVRSSKGMRGKMANAKRVSLITELMQQKKKIPGP